MHLNDYRYVFVLTYGRSGSTLLMKILNAVEGVDIRGENHNTLFWLYRAIDAAERARSHPGAVASDKANPWYGARAIDSKGFTRATLEAFVANVLRPPPGTVVTGFKEIRHTDRMMDAESFAGYVDFLLAHFPGARIVFNTRDAQAVARSGWFRNMDPEVVISLVETSNGWFRAAAERHDGCFVIDYADVVENGPKVADLFTFLGFEHDPQAVERILAVPLTHLKKGRRKGPLSRLLGRR